MTTIEKLFDGLVSHRAKSGVLDPMDAPPWATASSFPAPHGPPLSNERPETGTGSAGWYPDPTERHDLRFFDGKQWTDQRTRIRPIKPVRPSVSPARVGS
jgi:uncharacterized protein DUF2510